MRKRYRAFVDTYVARIASGDDFAAATTTAAFAIYPRLTNRATALKQGLRLHRLVEVEVAVARERTVANAIARGEMRVHPRNLRVPCSSCPEGYLRPVQLVRALTYRCTTCGIELPGSAHRLFKAAIMESIASGVRDLGYVVVERQPAGNFVVVERHAGPLPILMPGTAT